MDAQQSAIVLGPFSGRELCRLAGAHLGAEEDRLEARLHAGEGDTRQARLALAACSQPTLGIHASAMRLGVRMTK
jgi:hypothetical protein